MLSMSWPATFVQGYFFGNILDMFNQVVTTIISIRNTEFIIFSFQMKKP